MADHDRDNRTDNSLFGRLAKYLGVEKKLVTLMATAFSLLCVGSLLAVALYFFFTP